MDPLATPFIPDAQSGTAATPGVKPRTTAAPQHAGTCWPARHQPSSPSADTPRDTVAKVLGQSWDPSQSSPLPSVSGRPLDQPAPDAIADTMHTLDSLWCAIDRDSSRDEFALADPATGDSYQTWSVVEESPAEPPLPARDGGKRRKSRARARNRKGPRGPSASKGPPASNVPEDKARLSASVGGNRRQNRNKGAARKGPTAQGRGPEAGTWEGRPKTKSYAVGYENADLRRASAKQLRAELEAVHAKLELETSFRQREHQEKKKLEEIVERLTEEPLPLSKGDLVKEVEKSQTAKLRNELQLVRAKLEVEICAREALCARKDDLEKRVIELLAECSKGESVLRMLKYRVSTLEGRVEFYKKQLSANGVKAFVSEE